MRHCRYGYGDADQPNGESVALVNKLVFQYVETLCADARAVSRLRGEKITTPCFIQAIKSDKPKYLRVQDLLEMRARLKEIRKVDHGID